MGIFDDAASVISGAPSGHSNKHSKHRSSRHRDHHHRSRSRSHSRSRVPKSGGGLGGIAASIFGVEEGSDSDRKSRHGSHKKHRSSKHRDHSASRSFFGSLAGGGGDDYKKHSNSKASFFGLGGSGNASRGSFFGAFGGGGSRSPSYYKRSPRPNFVSRMLKRLKRLLRDLVYWAKKHPVKVFMLVIMPLITGGALTALLAKFGLRLPAALTGMLGLAAKASTGDGIGLVGEVAKMASGGLGGGGSGGATRSHTTIERGRDGGLQWERKSVEQDGFGLGSLGSTIGSSIGGLGSLAGMAKMFS